MSTYNDASLIYYPSGYKAGTAYSLKPTDGSGDLTFTRASTATRVNESGLIESVATGVPRIDFTGGGCGKLLLEPQRTNLVTQSVNLSSWSFSNWTKTINSATAPDGTNTANLIEQTTNGLIYASPATAESTLSVFLKYNSAMQFFQIMGNGDANTYANFDIVNGLVGNIGSLSKAEIKDYGSGWYRISMTILTGATLDYFRIKSVTSLTAAWNNGTIFSGSFYAWGGQVETGYATSYIPTSGTAVTRVRDSASKTPISSFLNTANPFTFYVNFERAEGTTPATYQLIGLDNGSYGEYIKLVNKSAQLKFYIAVKNSTTFTISADITNTPNIKVAIVYNGATSYKIFHNGALLQTLTLGACSLNRFASGENGMQFTTESYQSIMIFQSALSDADAIALTTI